MACCVESASSFSRGFIRGWVAVLGIKPRVQDKIEVAWVPAKWADGPATSLPSVLAMCPCWIANVPASVPAAFSSSTVLSESLVRQAIHGGKCAVREVEKVRVFQLLLDGGCRGRNWHRGLAPRIGSLENARPYVGGR